MANIETDLTVDLIIFGGSTRVIMCTIRPIKRDQVARGETGIILVYIAQQHIVSYL